MHPEVSERIEVTFFNKQLSLGLLSKEHLEKTLDASVFRGTVWAIRYPSERQANEGLYTAGIYYFRKNMTTESNTYLAGAS